ncbi:MAG: response regulator [Sphingobacteriaceae bacterium]|nr:MAG: response regulator [Sphingobacteriaceae bacterium]
MNAKSILVIDDSPALLELFEDILTGFGYAVITRPTGKKSLLILMNLF